MAAALPGQNGYSHKLAIACLLISSALFAGCGKKEPQAEVKPDPAPATAAASSTAASVQAAEAAPAAEQNVEKKTETVAVQIDRLAAAPALPNTTEALKDHPELYDGVCGAANVMRYQDPKCYEKPISWKGLMWNQSVYSFEFLAGGRMFNVYHKPDLMKTTLGLGKSVRVTGYIRRDSPYTAIAESIEELGEEDTQALFEENGYTGFKACFPKLKELMPAEHWDAMFNANDGIYTILLDKYKSTDGVVLYWVDHADANGVSLGYQCVFESRNVAKIAQINRVNGKFDLKNKVQLYEAKRGEMILPPRHERMSHDMNLAELKTGAMKFFREITSKPLNVYTREYAGTCSLQMDDAEKGERENPEHIARAQWKIAYDVCEGQARMAKTAPAH
jgi:hypothetical protein